MKKTILTLGAVGLTLINSQAVVTFVSVADDLSNISPAGSVTGISSETDNLWHQRDNFGEGDVTVIEGWDVGEDVPVLTMTLTGLLGGETYDIYVNYIRFSADPAGDQDGTRGGVNGSLDNSTFTLFNGAGGTAGSVGFSELTGHVEQDRAGLRGYLGTAVASGAGEISVFIDDDGLDGAIEERVWLDGLSYEIVPEPSSTALLGLGSLALMMRRRR